jgi:hypothetical protein
VEADALETTVDLLVRTVLSHVMQPGTDPGDIADGLSRAIVRLLS